MMKQQQIESLLHDLQHQAEQYISHQETAKAVTLLIYHEHLKAWLAKGQIGPPPVSATELVAQGLTVPSDWPASTKFDADGLREFPGLMSAAFQHPLDVQAVVGIQAVPLLGPLLAKLSSSVWERQMRLSQISNAVRLGPHQGQSLYRKFVKAATILDIPELPELYISNRYMINAYAFGIEKYQITLFSGLIDSLTDEELLAVIGHELGHVKCQHMLYKTMAFIMRLLGTNTLISLLPAGTGLLAALSLQLAVLHWERMAEFSCDRAALLVVQEPQIVANALTKLAGGSRRLGAEIDLQPILDQAEEYHEAGENLIEKLLKVNMMLFQTHPFPVVRAKEIMDWAESTQYHHILQGNYALAAATEPVALQTVGRYAANGRVRCARCQVMVFETWAKCPHCNNQLV